MSKANKRRALCICSRELPLLTSEERTKQVERETYSVFEHTTARSKVKNKLPYKCSTSSLPSKSCPSPRMEEKTGGGGLQMTQPTSGGTVTADTSCCASCVEPFLP